MQRLCPNVTTQAARLWPFERPYCPLDGTLRISETQVVLKAMQGPFSVSMMIWLVASSGSSSLMETAPSSPAATVVKEESSQFERLEYKTGVFIQQNGGPASLKSLSIRGSTSKDVGIFFEGVRLNSLGSGEFDLGLISPYGLGPSYILKGGHHSFSSSPQGALFLHLPEDDSVTTELSYGDYSTFALAQQGPGFSASFDRSDNDYAYWLNGQMNRRQNNEHSRLNLRAWHRGSQSQVWTQILFNDVMLPGPVTQSLTPISSSTLRPMAAFQYRQKEWNLNLFSFYQRQELNEKVNYSLGGMLRISYRSTMTKNLAAEINTEASLDWLKAPAFESPIRSMTLVNLNGFWTPLRKLLINPQIQTDYVSDLTDAQALTGSLGSRLEMTEALSLSSHLSYTSRAPNFNEMYFEIPPFFLSNQDLDRETSLQLDWGWNLKTNTIEASQTVYWIRTNHTIESVNTNGIFQAQNVGSGARLGIESDLRIILSQGYDLSLSYELLMARVQSSTESLWSFSPLKSPTRQLNQPLHKASVVPRLFVGRVAEISSPLTVRSSIRATNSNDQIPSQWNWNLNINAKPTKIWPLTTSLQIENLLSWNREESFGFPLGSEPRVTLSLMRTWN